MTAEALMRSRFEAFRDADDEWLLASWHPSKRPTAIDLGRNPRWRGLQILDVVGWYYLDAESQTESSG